MKNGTWAQELMWVHRDKNGVAIGVEENLPKNVEFIPTAPRVVHKPKGGSRANGTAISK